MTLPMRLGMILPIVDAGNRPLEQGSLAAGARRIEAAGFDSAWAFDAIGRGFILPDPLIALSVAASVTERIEVGTGILQVPLRRPVELAHRVLTASLVCGDRLLLGIGAGSTEADFDAVGVDYRARMCEFAASVDVMRRLWRGETVGSASLSPWPATVGGPKVLIGSWAGSRWIERAAKEFDGWIASAAKTSLRHLREGIKRYRDLGGGRAVVTNISVDLAATSAKAPCDDDSPFSLVCSTEAAADRLGQLAELGFDDAVLLSFKQTEEELARIRSLHP